MMNQLQQLHETMLFYQTMMSKNNGTKSGANYKKLYRNTKGLYLAERERVGKEVRESIK